MSGPWRSAPRPEVARAKADPQASPRPVVAPRDARGSSRWLRIALGGAAVLAIAALAVVVRPGLPGPPTTEVAPTAEVVPTAEEAPAAEVDAAAEAAPAPPPAREAPATAPAAEVPADPALAAVSVVRLRIGPDLPPELRAAILAALKAAGLDAVVVEPLPFQIATSRVGYYRAEDLAAAEALGRVVAPLIAPGGSVGVRDYHALLADAQPGRLDLWIGS